MISFNFFVLKASINCLLFLSRKTEDWLEGVFFYDFVAEFVVSLGSH